MHKIIKNWFKITPIYNKFIKIQTMNLSNKVSPGFPASTLDISGIFPPIITPFHSKTKELCYEGLAKNFEIWNKIAFSGYVVMGSNGEYVSLSLQEKLELTREVRRLSRNSVNSKIIIAGTGCQSTKETIELTNAIAADKSADAALVVTPNYYRGQLSDKALKIHFEKVADESQLPVILYSVPGNTQIDLSPEVIISLSSHKNIIGLKDSGGDIAKISRIIHETKNNNFSVLAGSASFLLPSMIMGSVGGVCALANVLGQEVCQLESLFKNNQIQEAIELQKKLIVPNALVTKKFGVPGLKAAMKLKGYFPGVLRDPLLPLEESELETLKNGFLKEGFCLLK